MLSPVTLSFCLIFVALVSSMPWDTQKWPADVPPAWDWCEKGYCSPIKIQCGGTCLNTAKMTVIESRTWLHLHPLSDTKPPAVPAFSMANFTYCGHTRHESIADWVQKYGVYAESDWPFEGTCGMCGNGMGSCNNTSCALKHLDQRCSEENKKHAIANDDPCLCALNARNEGGQRTIHPLCQAGLMKMDYAPCSCERMQRSVKRLFAPEDLAPALKNSLIMAHIDGNEPEPHDAGYARFLYRHGPSAAHVHPFSWTMHRDRPGDRCVNTSGHEITVVGWNWTASPPYWVIRNSWSDTMGDHGFLYVKMDCHCQGHGLCSDMD